jgi:hypothetical protein
MRRWFVLPALDAVNNAMCLMNVWETLPPAPSVYVKGLDVHYTTGPGHHDPARCAAWTTFPEGKCTCRT